MPRKKTTDPSTSVELTNSEVETEESIEPKEANVSTPNPPTPTPEPEVQLQPAEFSREGRTMVCTVCGTEARLDLDQQLFCPNAHNHPPLTTEASKS